MHTERQKPINISKRLFFWSLHCACLLALWTGVSPTAIFVCFFLYIARMFGITAGYHRYFSHRTYKTSRWFQLAMALLGCSAGQKGPIWWASHHRWHHRHSDTEEDIHSPIVSGFLHSHVGWVLSGHNIQARSELVRDLLKYPELRFLEKMHLLPGTVLALGVFLLGVWLNIALPQLDTTGPQLLVWGFIISTVLVYHGTFCINSLTHVIGTQRFKTNDGSKNNLLLALITLGEGWHNNHHRYPGAARQGMYWWEIDISHYLLKALEWLGLVWDLRPYPKRIYLEAEQNSA